MRHCTVDTDELVMNFEQISQEERDELTKLGLLSDDGLERGAAGLQTRRCLPN